MPHHQACCSYSDPYSHSNHLHPQSSSLNSHPISLPSNNQPHHHHPTTTTTTDHRCVATLKGHAASYTSSLGLAGKSLYTGSSDGEIRLLKCNTLTSQSNPQNLTGISSSTAAAGKGAVKSMLVLSDKKLLISAHQDHKIRVWKIDGGSGGDGGEADRHHKLARLATLPTLSDRVIMLLTPKNHVEIRRHKKCTWVHHVDAVSALALSRDESLLFSVSWDRTLKIWRTADFKCLESVTNAHDDAINAVQSSSDGRVYTGSADRTIKVWRKNPGEKKHSLVEKLERHDSGVVNALALSSDGSLYSGGGNGSVVVWEEAEDGGGMVVVGELRGHRKAVLCLAAVADLVCSGSADSSVRIWRGVGRCYSCLGVLEGHRGPVKCLSAASHEKNNSSSYLLCSGSLDCDVKLWQILVSRPWG